MLGTLYEDDDHEYVVWKWKPVEGARGRWVITTSPSSGSGMHPWGKWGRNFVEYGVVAARAALADAGLEWRDIQFVSGADTIRNGYPGYVVGRDVRAGARLAGRAGRELYAACASGATALNAARAQILAGLCDVALVVGADTTPKGFLAPTAGERGDDPDWLRFRLLGATNPTYFALYARRRMELFGATPADFAKVKVKNAAPRARATRTRATARRSPRTRSMASPMVADPLRLLEICATSDGAAAVVVSSLEYAQRAGRARPGAGRGDLDGDADVPEHGDRDAQLRHRLGGGGSRAEPATFRDSIAAAARTTRPGSVPTTSTSPRCTTCRPRSSSTGTRTSGCAGPGEAEQLLHDGDTTIGGRIPVNPSGGLACFGEAVPAQAIAQVCEVTWQLRGAGGRPAGRGRHESGSP